MAIRDNLFDNAYNIKDANGFMVEADLTVKPWNRATVADGQWLQDHAIGPLSARDLYLADQIDATNNTVNKITQTLNETGITTDKEDTEGEAGPLRNLVNAGCIRTYSYQAYGEDDSFASKQASLLPTTTTGMVGLPYSLGYLTVSSNSTNINGFSFVDKTVGSIIQANLNTGNAIQLGIGNKFLGVRYIGQTNPPTGNNYEYAANTTAFGIAPILMTNDLAGTEPKKFALQYNPTDKSFTTAAIDNSNQQNVINGCDTQWFMIKNNNMLSFKTDNGPTADGKNYFITKNGFVEYTPVNGPSYTFTGGLTADNNNVTLDIPAYNDSEKIYGFKRTSNNSITTEEISFNNYTTAGSNTITANDNNILNVKYDSSSGLTAGDNGLALNIAAGSGLDFTGGEVYVKTSDLTGNGITTANNKLAIDNSYVLNNITASYTASEVYNGLINNKSISAMIQSLVNAVATLSAEIDKKANATTNSPAESVTE